MFLFPLSFVCPTSFWLFPPLTGITHKDLPAVLFNETNPTLYLCSNHIQPSKKKKLKKGQRNVCSVIQRFVCRFMREKGNNRREILVVLNCMCDILYVNGTGNVWENSQEQCNGISLLIPTMKLRRSWTLPAARLSKRRILLEIRESSWRTRWHKDNSKSWPDCSVGYSTFICAIMSHRISGQNFDGSQLNREHDALEDVVDYGTGRMWKMLWTTVLVVCGTTKDSKSRYRWGRLLPSNGFAVASHH